MKQQERSFKDALSMLEQLVPDLEEVVGRPMVPEYTTVKVNLNPSEIFVEFNRQLFDEIERVTMHIYHHRELPYTLEDLDKYHRTMLFLRITHINDELPKDYRRIYQLRVHSYVAILLDQVGTARDDQYGIRFEPTTDMTVQDIMTPQELYQFSRFLETLEQVGFVQVDYKIKRTIEGSLAFMSLQHIDQVVKGIHSEHPTFGLMAAFFKQMAMYDSVGILPRVVYGYDDDYRLMIHRLSQLK